MTRVPRLCSCDESWITFMAKGAIHSPVREAVPSGGMEIW